MNFLVVQLEILGGLEGGRHPIVDRGESSRDGVTREKMTPEGQNGDEESATMIHQEPNDQAVHQKAGAGVEVVMENHGMDELVIAENLENLRRPNLPPHLLLEMLSRTNTQIWI